MRIRGSVEGRRGGGAAIRPIKAVIAPQINLISCRMFLPYYFQLCYPTRGRRRDGRVSNNCWQTDSPPPPPAAPTKTDCLLSARPPALWKEVGEQGRYMLGASASLKLCRRVTRKCFLRWPETQTIKRHGIIILLIKILPEICGRPGSWGSREFVTVKPSEAARL